MPSIVQSMVLIFSRLLILFPKDIFGFLTDFTVENRIGLKVLIDKWLLHQPLFRGKYFKNISIKALTHLYIIKDPIIESLMVIGYDPSHSTASVEVNAPFKILSVLIRCLNKEILQEKIKNKGDSTSTDETNNISSEYQNEVMESDTQAFQMQSSDQNAGAILDVNTDEFLNLKDEDYNAKEINSKLNFINQGRAGGLSNIEAGSEIYLSEMLGFDYNDIEGDDEDDVEEDLVYFNDIEYNFVLKDFLLDFFTKFSNENENYFIECLKMLPNKDQEMYKSFKISSK